MRTSWDTSVKHLARVGLLRHILSKEEIGHIPSSNLSRWRNEPEDKYVYAEINKIAQKEIELIKRLNQSSRIKKINKAYFRLIDTLHQLLSHLKGVKNTIRSSMEIVVDSIQEFRKDIPIDNALKIFDISRGTFENYKTIVIHKCESSYFAWCLKRFGNQLMPREVRTIKAYMEDDNYSNWSKSSIYLRAVRDGNLKCALNTFYKYCRLLGFKGCNRTRRTKNNSPVRTTKPNELWCADVTIFKTTDGMKHYIHLLMDHFSKYILGFRVSLGPSAMAIKELLKGAYKKHKPRNPTLLTDGGPENVNKTVSCFVNAPGVGIRHQIAQKDVIYSNSMIEALNKVLKYQFLYPQEIKNSKQLKELLEKSIEIYNQHRPQLSLAGNTPSETFNHTKLDLNQYLPELKSQRARRLEMNKKRVCKRCC